MTVHPMPYPWLQDEMAWLEGYIESDRVPQALLLHGPSGVGKRWLAERWIHQLLCEAPGIQICGICQSCQLLLAGTHPDFERIEPEEKGKGLKVDQVRTLIDHLALKPQYQGYRCVLIEPAHLMNLSAANALLKTLEEPSEKTVIVLVSSHPQALPATILSRCQKLLVQKPDKALALEWLRSRSKAGDAALALSAAGGAPLRALAYLEADAPARQRQTIDSLYAVILGKEDPLALAERWLEGDHEELLDWIQQEVLVLMRVTQGLNPPSDGALSGIGGPDSISGKCLSPGRLWAFWQTLLDLRKALGGQANRQLLLEELLIEAARLTG